MGSEALTLWPLFMESHLSGLGTPHAETGTSVGLCYSPFTAVLLAPGLCAGVWRGGVVGNRSLSWPGRWAPSSAVLALLPSRPRTASEVGTAPALLAPTPARLPGSVSRPCRALAAPVLCPRNSCPGGKQRPSLPVEGGLCCLDEERALAPHGGQGPWGVAAANGVCLPAQDPYFMKNHLGSYECKLCLTLHNNEVRSPRWAGLCCSAATGVVQMPPARPCSGRARRSHPCAITLSLLILGRHSERGRGRRGSGLLAHQPAPQSLPPPQWVYGGPSSPLLLNTVSADPT